MRVIWAAPFVRYRTELTDVAFPCSAIAVIAPQHERSGSGIGMQSIVGTAECGTHRSACEGK